LKVLMYGWEFPPHNSGGLGTACYGLTKSLSKFKAKICFVLPYIKKDFTHSFLKLVSPSQEQIKNSKNFKKIRVNSVLSGYLSSEEYQNLVEQNKKIREKIENNIYGPNLFAEVERYAQEASKIAQTQEHNIIHAHDWLTYKAGIQAKKISQKPLVIHVHATEFDRTGGHGVNPYVYQIEKQGMELADHIIAVSNYTKNKIIQHYNIPKEKITVVHNAVDFSQEKIREKLNIRQKEKIILFLGRITIQKGPDWFIKLAKKILDHDKNFKFVVVGSGDMADQVINKAAELDIADKVLFTGFLRGPELDQIYQMAHFYVMPSVSEPFGITPLEAMRNHTPCLISKQSGVSEVIHHCLKADFWDIDDMANKIISILRYSDGYNQLKENSCNEVKKFTWDKPAQECLNVYKRFRD